MHHYKCQHCDLVFQSRNKVPRCPKCNRVTWVRHNPIIPERKIEYEVKKFNNKEDGDVING